MLFRCEEQLQRSLSQLHAEPESLGLVSANYLLLQKTHLIN